MCLNLNLPESCGRGKWGSDVSREEGNRVDAPVLNASSTAVYLFTIGLNSLMALILEGDDGNGVCGKGSNSRS